MPARARTASVVLAGLLLAVGGLLGVAPGHPGRPDPARAVTVVSDHGAALAAHGQRLVGRPHTGTDHRVDVLPWAAPSALLLLFLPLLVAVRRRRIVTGLLRAPAGRARPRAPPAAV